MEKWKNFTDAQLVEKAKTDPESFGRLMEKYQGALSLYIRRIGQLSAEDTQDLLQEVFIKIYQKLNEYEETLQFSSWAYRIAHNHVMDHFRKIKARPRADALEAFEWEKLVSAGVSMEKKLIQKDCVEKIKLGLTRLPLEYREILILRFIEEKSYEEIMDILKKPKGSVATLLSRGKNRLRKIMKEDGLNCF